MGGGDIQRVNPMRSKLLDKTRPYVFFRYTILCKHFLRDLQIFAPSVAPRLLDAPAQKCQRSGELRKKGFDQ